MFVCWILYKTDLGFGNVDVLHSNNWKSARINWKLHVLYSSITKIDWENRIIWDLLVQTWRGVVIRRALREARWRPATNNVFVTDLDQFHLALASFCALIYFSTSAHFADKFHFLGSNWTYCLPLPLEIPRCAWMLCVPRATRTVQNKALMANFHLTWIAVSLI